VHFSHFFSSDGATISCISLQFDVIFNHSCLNLTHFDALVKQEYLDLTHSEALVRTQLFEFDSARCFAKTILCRLNAFGGFGSNVIV
jgi:hypothetical protein